MSTTDQPSAFTCHVNNPNQPRAGREGERKPKLYKFMMKNALQSIEFPHMFHVIFGIEGEMREGKENR